MRSMSFERDAVQVRARERGIVEAPAVDQHQRVVGRVLAEAAHAHDHAASAVADGVADLQAGARRAAASATVSAPLFSMSSRVITLTAAGLFERRAARCARR